MDSLTNQQQVQNNFQEMVGVRDAVLRGKPTNPALQRLQARVLQNTNPSEVITSYDRMHHRHNRS